MSREVCGICWCPYDEDTGECACAPQSPPQRPAEPVQEPDPGEYHGWVLREVLFEKGEPVGHREPVAYSVGRTLHWHEGKGVNDAQLYLAPPQRKPLSEDEIVTMYDESPRGDSDMIAFARAVERAHGIGGEHEQR